MSEGRWKGGGNVGEKGGNIMEGEEERREGEAVKVSE